MKIEQCGRGHFYDSEKYIKCPFCYTDEDVRKKIPESPATQMRNQTAQPRKSDSGYMQWKEAEEASEVDRTMMEAPELMTHYYTTGWLVCVEGPEKGRDYRLRYGFNQIGRSHKMDVCIFEDDGISRTAHCSVVYENRKNRFLLVPGNGSMTFMEDALLEKPVLLHNGDRFQIGDTVLEFIAFCRDDIKWEN